VQTGVPIGAFRPPISEVTTMPRSRWVAPLVALLIGIAAVMASLGGAIAAPATTKPTVLAVDERPC
jgi:hypothetical protein